MKTNAHGLDWSHQRMFSKSEWPLGTLDQLNCSVISALFDVRDALPRDHSLIPSPLYGAHVRKIVGSGSRHNILKPNGETRLSDATDFFCKREHAWRVWFELLKHPKINGVGVYQNAMLKGSTTDWTMFHIDTRPADQKAMWVAVRENPKHSYTYYSINRNHAKFFESLALGGLWE